MSDSIDNFPLAKVLRLQDLAFESYVDNLQFSLNLILKLVKKSFDEDESGALIIAEYYQNVASSLYEFCQFDQEESDDFEKNNQKKYRQIVQIIQKVAIQTLEKSQNWEKENKKTTEENIAKILKNWNLQTGIKPKNKPKKIRKSQLIVPPIYPEKLTSNWQKSFVWQENTQERRQELWENWQRFKHSSSFQNSKYFLLIIQVFPVEFVLNLATLLDFWQNKQIEIDEYSYILLTKTLAITKQKIQKESPHDWQIWTTYYSQIFLGKKLYKEIKTQKEIGQVEIMALNHWKITFEEFIKEWIKMGKNTFKINSEK